MTLARRLAGQDTTHTEVIMRFRTSIAATGGVAALGLTGAFLLPAAASAHTATHTLRFTAVQQATTSFSRTTGAVADKDVNKAGKVIGFDVLTFSFNQKTKTVSIGATVDVKGGFLYGVLHQGKGPVSRGKVTGGTGSFRHATGTITARNLNNAGTRTAVTITYHT
jgi:hypothetical protein